MSLNAFPKGSFPTNTFPKRTFPIAGGIFVKLAEVWRATVVMARRDSKTVTMNRRVTDTYDELENL